MQRRSSSTEPGSRSRSSSQPLLRASAGRPARGSGFLPVGRSGGRCRMRRWAASSIGGPGPQVDAATRSPGNLHGADVGVLLFRRRFPVNVRRLQWYVIVAEYFPEDWYLLLVALRPCILFSRPIRRFHRRALACLGARNTSPAIILRHGGEFLLQGKRDGRRATGTGKASKMRTGCG